MKIITRCINITAYIYLLRARSKGEGGGLPVLENLRSHHIQCPVLQASCTPPLYGSTKITENVSINR